MPPFFITCTQCKGDSYIKTSPCPQCLARKRPSVCAKLLHNVLTFDFNRITEWEITKRRAVIKVDFSVNFILYIIALLGFLVLGFYIFITLRSASETVSLPFGFFNQSFWNIENWYMRLFFVTFMSDQYLIYRLFRKEERKVRVIKRQYQDAPLLKMDVVDKELDITDAYSHHVFTILEEAYFFAVNNKYTHIAPLHLLAMMLTTKEANIILFRLGINPGVLGGKIKRGLQGMLYQQQQEEFLPNRVVFTREAKQVVLQAYIESYNRGGGKQVDLTDLWMPIAEIESYAQEILYDLDVESYKLRHVVQWFKIERDLRAQQSHRRSRSGAKSKYGMNRAMTAVQTRFLDAFSQDLTVLAKRGFLPPSLGHERELDQIFTVLQGGALGAVLVGNPGVGKQSLVEEIAERMAAELVPEVLQDKRLVSLSVAAIMAGGDTGQSAERLYQALYEAAHSGNIVLFIKDIHNLVGIGLRGEGGAGAMGIDQVLVQAMESGSFLVLGTSDYKSFSRYIEKSSLYEILTRIDIKEPEPNEAVLMLEARVPFIEGKHHVFFTYQALEKAVELANKLIHGEHQPEKALKILQETASHVAVEKGQRQMVTEADVAQIVAAKVNMPLTRIEKQESEKLMHLEDEIHTKYVNQDYAVKQVSAALRRSRAGLRDERRPIANFLFVGPTGVGKTELAKRIAEIYFNSEKDMIRIDMSEFQEISSIDRLIGTPQIAGLLTEAVRNNPFSILLLDELEKAHKNILNIFLQVMDDGRLTSGEGEVIDFTNLIIVATSNAGTRILQEKIASGQNIDSIRDEFIRKDLLEFFKPEFINRFDDVIIFKPLSPKDIEEIAKFILEDIRKRLDEKHGIIFRATQEAVKELAEAGFDPLYGARPLRRAIQDHVQNALANFLIAGQIKRRDTVTLEPGGGISIKKAKSL